MPCGRGYGEIGKSRGGRRDTRSIPPPSMIRLNQWVCWTNQPFPLPPCPGMKPKWTKDDTRLMARALPFFVGMFSLASFFNGDGLLAGARAGLALWLITIGALGYVAWALSTWRRPRAKARPKASGRA